MKKWYRVHVEWLDGSDVVGEYVDVQSYTYLGAKGLALELIRAEEGDVKARVPKYEGAVAELKDILAPAYLVQLDRPMFKPGGNDD